MRVQIFLFGRFEVCREGQPLPPETWKNKKTQALLKILAGDRGRVFSADELIEYLWPGEELDLRSAASNLRNRVAELRKILEPQLERGERSRYIRTQRGGYALCAESDCWVDVEEFSRLEERGRRAFREGRLDEAISALEGAISLSRGEFLAEDRYEEWAVQARERWRERLVEILSLVAECLARRGQYRAALAHLERAVQETPLNETLYRQLMVYSFCAGETARAHRAYAQCRSLLERELGERPSSQTEELYKQIQSAKIPGLERIYPASVLSLPALPRVIQRPPFVGRQKEWNQLASIVQNARSAGERIVLIYGEAGVGKTRLGEEFLSWAQAKVSAQTLIGRCYEVETPLFLHPWLEALRGGASRLRHGDLADLQPTWLAELAQLLPEIRSAIPDLPPSPALPPEHRQYRFFETLYTVINALALQQAPTLFLLDDLQWADVSSLDFLCYIIERFAQQPPLHPIVILGTVRSEELPPGHGLERVRHQGLRLRELTEIYLQRLREQEIQDLVQSLADELETTADFGGRLYRESLGNPLFVTAALQALFENGAFTQEGNRWQLTDPTSLKLPSQALGLIERRVTRLSAAAQRVLQLVACAVQIELEVLEAAWEGTSEELFTHLTDLTSQGLLVERGGRYEFAHDKVREVVYNGLPQPRRLWLHRRIAQAIEHAYPDPAAVGFAGQLAQHYELGEQPRRALEWVLKAIQEYSKSHQPEAELQMIDRGLQLLHKLEGLLNKQEQLEKEFTLILDRLSLQHQRAEWEAFQQDLERLLSLSEALDIPQKAQALHWKASWYTRIAHYSEALRYATEALSLCTSQQDLALQAAIWDQIGLIHFRLGDYQSALRYYQKALDIFRTCDRLKEAHAWNDCGNVLAKMGEYKRALEQYETALKIYRELQDQRKASAVLNNMGATLRYLGEYQKALECLKQACTTDQETGDRLGLGFSLCNLAQVYRMVGLFQKALALNQEAYKIFSNLEDQFGQSMMQRWIGIIYRELGDYAQAQSFLQQALENVRSMGAQAEEGECLLELAKIFIDSGQPHKAQRPLQQASKLSHQLQSPYLTARIFIAQSTFWLMNQNGQEALSSSQQALQLISTHQWGGEVAIHAHFAHYRVLQALNHPEASDALRKAYDELQRTANQITDESLRASFLNIPLHREILSAAQTLSSQQPKQKTPKNS